ncbi:hypothetical protein ACFFSY_01485 [Paenibacillus aurantiacus]|uniref:DUF4309 domain-containing protein n=1 Tax=Paenibacillus aurantiacus TaxID=1936118 RepID=A0ABV5KHA5_9BACL
MARSTKARTLLIVPLLLVLAACTINQVEPVEKNNQATAPAPIQQAADPGYEQTPSPAAYNVSNLALDLPQGWSLSAEDGLSAALTDENGVYLGGVDTYPYADDFDFKSYKPNHSEITLEETIETPIGSGKLYTLDADNGTAASGLTGTHDVYYAVIPIPDNIIYVLEFSNRDKEAASKAQFVNMLSGLRLTSAQAEDVPQAQEAAPASAAHGDQLLQPFLQAVRAQDGKKLADLLVSVNPEYYRDYLHIDEAFMNRFLKMLSAEMDPGTIQAELQESGERQEAYKVTGESSGDSVTIEDLLYVSLPEGAEQPSLDWSYIRYLPYAEAMASEYVRLIQAGDAEQLARFSVVDDAALTTADAKKVISIYGIYFDNLRQAELTYTGGLQFEVRDGSDNIHTFRIQYGDGLMWIDDSFTPASTAF